MVDDELAREAVRLRGVEPEPELLLTEDPARMSLREAVPYVLRVQTNRILIVSSALGYFFLAGLSTFAVVFVRGHYHTSQTTATGVLGLIINLVRREGPFHPLSTMAREQAAAPERAAGERGGASQPGD